MTDTPQSNNVVDLTKFRERAKSNVSPLNLDDSQRAEIELIQERYAAANGEALERFIREILEVANDDYRAVLVEFVIAAAANRAAALICTVGLSSVDIDPVQLSQGIDEVFYRIMEDADMADLDDVPPPTE